MGSENWSLTAKLCDSCKSASATVFCRADSAFLCLSCDCKIHAANKLASRHARVWVCEVCEQAPASVTCKADAAALCVTCDRDIHSANPLARRHERFPVVPFYDSAVANVKSNGENEHHHHHHFVHHDHHQQEEEEQAEAASWILPIDPKEGDTTTTTDNHHQYNKSTDNNDYLFNDMDSYLDIDIMSYEQKPHIIHQHQHGHYTSDGVVPVQNNNEATHLPGPVVDGFPSYDMEFTGSKPYLYNFNSQSISQSVSSSSMDVGVVPDHSTITDVSNNFVMNSSATGAGADAVPNPVSGLDREARVMRYREKRKNRKFEKTIRYASRKAYAETRPRIKGRFAKRTENIEIDSIIVADGSYGVVPSF